MSATCDVLVNLSPYIGHEEGVSWINALQNRAEHVGVKYFLALPFDVLNAVKEAPAFPFVMKGAQRMNPVQEGDFTEAIAARLLSHAGAGFVLLGSRRARNERDSNESIRHKLKKAKEGGLMPILCIGETAEERQQVQTAEVLTRQIGEATLGLEAGELAGLQVVYEAPWIEEAFSRPEDQEIDHAYQFCRDLVHSLFGEPLASSVKVYCPVPSDLKEVEGFIHKLHADGFYFRDPHQLTAIDETVLRAKVSATLEGRDAEETSAGEPLHVSAKESAKEAAKQATEEAAEPAQENAIEKAAEPVQQEQAQEEEREEGAQQALSKQVLTEETAEALQEATKQAEQVESALEFVEPAEEVKKQAEESGAMAEEEAAEEETLAEGLGVDFEVSHAGMSEEATQQEEQIPEEQPKEKVRDVKISHISAPVAEAKKRKKKPKE